MPARASDDPITFIRGPLLALSVGYLFVRYLARPPARASTRLQLMAELAGVLVIAHFLVFISGFRLLVGTERVGVACMFFLLCALHWLPLVLWQRTAVRQRFARVRQPVARALLLLILVAATAATSLLWLRTSEFPGGPPAEWIWEVIPPG
jgi:hypothetical protein